MKPFLEIRNVTFSSSTNHYLKNYVIFEKFKILHIFHKYLNSKINILAFLIFLNVLKPDELKKKKYISNFNPDAAYATSPRRI